MPKTGDCKNLHVLRIAVLLELYIFLVGRELKKCNNIGKYVDVVKGGGLRQGN